MPNLWGDRKFNLANKELKIITNFLIVYANL